MKKKTNGEGQCRIEEILCRTALSPSLLPGLNYALNPYYGCQHACRYCYVPNVFHIIRQEWGKSIKPKINIPRILSKELKTTKRGLVGISTVTDPYQPLEKKYHLTRYCLEQLRKHDFPINILTKSTLIKKDIDIIEEFSECAVGMTIPSLNQDEIEILEPFTPPVQKRLETLTKFSKKGIYTYIFFGPIYPTIDTDNLPYLLKKYFSTGIKELIVDTFHLKPGIWPNIKDNLPVKTREIFKTHLFNKTYYPAILELIEKQCQKNGILYQKAFAH